MTSRARGAPRPGTLFLVVATTATAAAALLDLQVPEAHRDVLGMEAGWTGGVPGLALAWAAAAVLNHDPRHRLGWVLGVFGVWWTLDSAAASYLAYATLDQPPAAGASVAFWVFQRLGAGLLLVLPLVLVLFPDGRLPAGRWRALGLLAVGLTALLPLTLTVVPSRIPQERAGDLPAPLQSLELDPVALPVPDEVWTVLLSLAFLMIAVSLVPALAVVVHRYRSAAPDQRLRMRWLLWAAIVDVLVMVTLQLLPGHAGSWGLTAAVVLTCGAVVVAITRPAFVDVDRLLEGTLVYGVLLAATLLLDVLVLAAARSVLGTRLDSDQALVLAVFVVAVCYAPVRHRVAALVRRRLFGDREDPYAVVSSLAERLEDSGGTEVQLLTVARAVADAFRIPYVGVEIRQSNGEVLLAEEGRRPQRVRALPVSYRGEHIGRLLLPEGGVRSTLRAADERLLADVVRQAAAAARADRLAAELQRSRERLVTAVEDERRRLRRELHDGLGPTLAGVASRIDTARITASRDPEESERMLAVARSELSGMLTEVRRLVHGLRPPALDEVGLVRAVGRLAEQVAPPGLDVEVTAPAELAGLPAAVEVAAYRIVSEALTNVVRHANARSCRVQLAVEDGTLLVQVVDDGVGIPTDTSAGVGLLSLRERAEELGGRCTVAAGVPTGTRVRAELPLPTLAATSATLTAARERWSDG